MKDPNDRFFGYLILGVIFGGLGALFGSINGASGALAGAMVGLVFLFGLYLQYRDPF